jgi:hypothetical protein
MGNDKKAVKDSEGERWYGEEVHRGDGLMMIAQEGRPSLRRFRISRRLPHPAQHGSLRNIEAHHFDFSVNAWRTPSGVLSDHAEDEFAQLLANASSSHACPMPREPGPIQLESRPMPPSNRLRLDKDQCPPPSWPKPPQNHPEQFVLRCESRMWTFLF